MILYVLLFKRTESENFIFGSLHTPGLNCFNHAATQNAKFLLDIRLSGRVNRRRHERAVH